MRGATRRSEYRYGISAYISIHAPHARSDLIRRVSRSRLRNFNPRSSCEERRYSRSGLYICWIFQSTLLMRGATTMLHKEAHHTIISIHAPHARSDPLSLTVSIILRTFQSTLLMRGATGLHRARRIIWFNFNPRSSCEERPDFRSGSLLTIRFQSTLLMRGATVSILGIDLPDFIIYFSRTYPFSPKMPTSRHLSCKLHFLCDGTSHFGDL